MKEKANVCWRCQYRPSAIGPGALIRPGMESDRDILITMGLPVYDVCLQCKSEVLSGAHPGPIHDRPIEWFDKQWPPGQMFIELLKAGAAFAPEPAFKVLMRDFLAYCGDRLRYPSDGDDDWKSSFDYIEWADWWVNAVPKEELPNLHTAVCTIRVIQRQAEKVRDLDKFLGLVGPLVNEDEEVNCTCDDYDHEGTWDRFQASCLVHDYEEEEDLDLERQRPWDHN